MLTMSRGETGSIMASTVGVDVSAGVGLAVAAGVGLGGSLVGTVGVGVDVGVGGGDIATAVGEGVGGGLVGAAVAWGAGVGVDGIAVAGGAEVGEGVSSPPHDSISKVKADNAPKQLNTAQFSVQFNFIVALPCLRPKRKAWDDCIV